MLYALNDLFKDIYLSKEPICEEGRLFLTERNLSIPVAHKTGFCSTYGDMYFFYFLHGKPVRYKYRSMTNKKEQKWGPWKDGLDNDTPIPFYSQFKAPETNDLIITEGEFDCIALMQLGASNCVSLPNGASSVEKTFKAYYKFLQQFETIYIAFDMDAPGEEAAKKAMSLLPPSKCRRINFLYKDANEWVKQCDPSLDDLKHLMVNSISIESPHIVHINNLPSTYYDEIDAGASTGWPNLNKLLGGIRTGEVTVVSADTGSGKTTFCLNICKNLMDQDLGVWINSYEMSPNIVNRKIMGLVLNKCYKVGCIPNSDIDEYYEWAKRKSVYVNPISTIVTIKMIRELVELACWGYGIKYMLFDHLDYIVSGGVKATLLENIDTTVRELHTLALEFNVSIILVVHPKQMQSGHDITINDLKGSSAIKQYADNIILLTRMDRNNIEDKRYKVHIGKNRLLGTEGYAYLHYDPQCDGYKEISFQKNPFGE